MGNKSSDDEHDQIISQRRVRIRSSKPAVPSGGIGATLPLMDELSTRASPADVVHEISAGAMKQIGNQLENLNDDLEETFKRLQPLSITKSTAVRLLVENKRTLIKLCVEASIYCAGFHETKNGLKRATSGFPIVGRPVSYLCDVMLPTVLYGPICGFLLRLKLPF